MRMWDRIKDFIDKLIEDLQDALSPDMEPIKIPVEKDPKQKK